ncbi:MAG: hypothetical protein FWH19_02435 [Treponema sp.]|nr:hypothetical protein [Treponema sp.]
MKNIGKIVFILVFVLFSIGCATKDTVREQPAERVVYFAFDFDTNQSVTPFPDYGAAYIINISNETISIPISTYIDTTMFRFFYYDESGVRPVFTEMMLPRVNRNNFIVLEPGARVLAYSVAFWHANLDRYPDAAYDATIVVNDRIVHTSGHVRR